RRGSSLRTDQAEGIGIAGHDIASGDFDVNIPHGRTDVDEDAPAGIRDIGANDLQVEVATSRCYRVHGATDRAVDLADAPLKAKEFVVVMHGDHATCSGILDGKGIDVNVGRIDDHHG